MCNDAGDRMLRQWEDARTCRKSPISSFYLGRHPYLELDNARIGVHIGFLLSTFRRRLTVSVASQTTNEYQFVT